VSCAALIVEIGMGPASIRFTGQAVQARFQIGALLDQSRNAIANITRARMGL
jgi:hypothetical protein